MSFRLARSPDAPKMTTAHGSAVRSRRIPARIGFSTTVAACIFNPQGNDEVGTLNDEPKTSRLSVHRSAFRVHRFSKLEPCGNAPIKFSDCFIDDQHKSARHKTIGEGGKGEGE